MSETIRPTLAEILDKLGYQALSGVAPSPECTAAGQGYCEESGICFSNDAMANQVATPEMNRQQLTAFCARTCEAAARGKCNVIVPKR